MKTQMSELFIKIVKANQRAARWNRYAVANRHAVASRAVKSTDGASAK
jgi:hypothetical protein